MEKRIIKINKLLGNLCIPRVRSGGRAVQVICGKLARGQKLTDMKA